MTQINRKTNVKRYGHIALMFILMFGTGYLPPFAAITPMGMKILGIFMGLIYGWCFIDLTWPSVFGFIALGTSGSMTIMGALTTAFSNSTVLTLIIVCVFSEYLKRLGVNEAIAYWVMSKKVFLGRPWLLAIGLMITSILVGTAGGNFAGLFLLWGVIDIIAKENNIEKGSFFISIIYAVVLYGVMIGTAHVPFQAGFILFTGFFTQATGLTIPNGQFLIIGELYIFLTLLLLILIVKCFMKVDASKFLMTEDMRTRYVQYKMNNNQKLALILLAIYFLALMLPSFVKADLAICQAINTLGIVGMSILYMAVFSILGDDTGKALINMAEAFKQGIVWPTVLLLAVTMPLGSVMTSADVGIMATISTFCLEHLGGLNIITLEILAVVLIGFMTQFMHNVVLGMIFIPVLVPLIITMGGNPYVMFFAIHSALACSYATPAGCMQAGLIFGKEGIPAKHASISGWLLYAASCLAIIALFPLINILLPF